MAEETAAAAETAETAEAAAGGGGRRTTMGGRSQSREQWLQARFGASHRGLLCQNASAVTTERGVGVRVGRHLKERGSSDSWREAI